MARALTFDTLENLIKIVPEKRKAVIWTCGR
jgi:hypothetical protein